MKKLKGSLLIVTPIVLVIIVVFLVFIFKYYFNSGFFPADPAYKIALKQAVTVQPTPTSNKTQQTDTTDWKTYRNEEHGFEFKYPKSWHLTDLDASYYPKVSFWLRVSETDNGFIWTSTPFPYPWFDHPGHPITGLNFILTKAPEVDLNKTGYNCNLDHEGCAFLFKYTQTTFLNHKARLTIAEFPNIDDPALKDSFGGQEINAYSYLAFQNGSQNWVISYKHSDFKQNHNPIFDQILSTFKFTKLNQTVAKPTGYQSPVAGICAGPTNDPVATVLFYPDNIPSPRCLKIGNKQKLKIINSSNIVVNVDINRYQVSIQPNNSYEFPEAPDAFLGTGIHSVGGVEIWIEK